MVAREIDVARGRGMVAVGVSHTMVFVEAGDSVAGGGTAGFVGAVVGGNLGVVVSRGTGCTAAVVVVVERWANDDSRLGPHCAEGRKVVLELG